MDSIINQATVVRFSDDIVVRNIEDELIIVPLTADVGNVEDKLYSLNETGKAIWEYIDGKNSLGTIATILSEQYEDISQEEIMPDIIGFVQELVNRRILLMVE